MNRTVTYLDRIYPLYIMKDSDGKVIRIIKDFNLVKRYIKEGDTVELEKRQDESLCDKRLRALYDAIYAVKNMKF